MSAREARDLAIRAEMLADTDDLAGMLAEILDGAGQAGADPRVVTGLIGAIKTLDPVADVRYNAGSPSDRRRNTGPYSSEWEFLEAVADAEDQIQVRCREVADLRERVTAAMEQAGDDLTQARYDLTEARAALAAAYAMGTEDPCQGCHGRRAAAIAAAEALIADGEARIGDAEQRIALCETAAEILDPLATQLTAALERIRRVAPDLGEVYELVYTFVRAGGKLPDYARWIEAEEVNA